MNAYLGSQIDGVGNGLAVILAVICSLDHLFLLFLLFLLLINVLVLAVAVALVVAVANERVLIQLTDPSSPFIATFCVSSFLVLVTALKANNLLNIPHNAFNPSLYRLLR